MLSSTPLLFTTFLLLPTALSITTIQAYLAPTNAAASVLAVTPSATTYSIVCTSLCASVGENNQATLVNGPSTAGFTQIMGDARTLIVDCNVIGQDKGDCATKAISAGETRTVKGTMSFKKEDVVITAGVEKLGYKVVTSTAEVNVTQTVATITSGTATVTSGVPKTSGSGPSNTAAASASRSSNLLTSAAAQQTSSSSAGAAPTMGAERIGAAIVGLAGLMLAAL